MINRRTLIWSLGLAGIFSQVCCGQAVNLRDCFGKQYGELLTIFQQWNEKKLTLSKSEFGDDFRAEIERLAPSEPEGWGKSRIALWERLGPKLSPELQLSTGAQVLLLGLYSENSQEFLQTYPDSNRRTYRLQLKLYLILSLAQDSAKKSKASEIQSSEVFVAIRQAFTGLWPFCHRAKPRAT